jgi:Ion channel
VGYGDLTARTDVGRMLAVSEALIGQLYLVSVVALLVSNIGRSRIRKADWDEDAPRRDGAE